MTVIMNSTTGVPQHDHDTIVYFLKKRFNIQSDRMRQRITDELVIRWQAEYHKFDGDVVAFLHHVIKSLY